MTYEKVRAMGLNDLIVLRNELERELSYKMAYMDAQGKQTPIMELLNFTQQRIIAEIKTIFDISV